MSKLLNENTVARWHKLAQINEGLSKNFLKEMVDMHPEEEDLTDDGMGAGDEVDAELPVDDEPPLDDGGLNDAPMDLSGGDVSMSEEDVTALVDDIAAAISQHTGVEVDVTGDALGADELEAPLGGGEEDFPPEDDLGLDTEDDLGYDDSGEDEELEGLAESLKSAKVKVLDEKRIVNEITKRVAKRILASIKK